MTSETEAVRVRALRSPLPLSRFLELTEDMEKPAARSPDLRIICRLPHWGIDVIYDLGVGPRQMSKLLMQSRSPTPLCLCADRLSRSRSA